MSSGFRGVSVASGKTFTWTGTSSITGGTTISGAGTVRNLGTVDDSTATMAISGHFNNAGTFTRGGTNNGLDLSGGVFTNEATGKLVLANGADTTTFSSGTIHNAGTIQQTANHTLTISSALDNTGTVEVDAGTLNLTGTVTQYSASSLTGGTWNMVNGTLNFPTGSNFTTITSGASVTFSGALANFNRLSLASSSLTTIQGSLSLLGVALSTAAALSNSGTFTVGTGSTATITGAYTQSAGTTQVDGTLNSSTTTVTVNGGTLKGTGTVGANVTSHGTVAPGDSPGILHINGNFTQASDGTLSLEVQGTNPATPDYDQLLISGTATLGGTLNVTLLGGFVPELGDQFTTMTYSSRSGDFGTINLPPTVGGRQVLSPAAGSTSYKLNGATAIVTTTADSGRGSLRQEILDTNSSVGADYIEFEIAGSGVHTISPASALPTISDPVTIDGTSQSGYGGTPLVLLDGASAARLREWCDHLGTERDGARPGHRPLRRQRHRVQRGVGDRRGSRGQLPRRGGGRHFGRG